MEALFLKLLSMSIPASILIGVVVLLRVLLRKSPKWIHCILWGLVAIRLVCPFSIESEFSLVPNADTVNTRSTGEQVLIQPDVTYTAHPESDDVTEPKQQEHPEADKKEKTEQWDALSVISWVWLAGCMTLSAYALFGYFRIKKSVKLSVRTQENIYICDRIRSPFILGVIRPRIYLPSNMSEVQKENVIAHEKAHIKRLDYLWKPFGFFLLIVYWFNPLCWLAYILLCRDIELACDEKVIRDMDINQKKIYSEVLLSFSDSEKVITACPLAFGEVGARQRIKSVLSYKKPGFWIIVAAIVLIVVTSVLFLTNQSKEQVNKPNQFAIVYDAYESAVKIEDGHIYQYEADDTWTDIGITGQASQVFSGADVCVLMEDGSLYYDGMTVVPTEEVYSNLDAYGIYMVGKALEENETEPFVSVNQNMEFSGFRALLQSGEILYDDGEGKYKRFVLPEETPVFLSGEYVLSEEGNVFRLHADTDGFGRGPYTKLEQVYDGGDIAVISASETADCCIGIRENGRVDSKNKRGAKFMVRDKGNSRMR